jgi:hypothetical protein
MMRPSARGSTLPDEVQQFIVTIEGPNFTDVEDLEMLGLPAEGDPIHTKYGMCIVTGSEFLPDGRQYDGSIVCRLP